jgi:hypothetical protein
MATEGGACGSSDPHRCVRLPVVDGFGCRSGQEQWGPFRGQVVDEETGKPIAGANVMVLWIREPPSLHFTQSFYDAQETVTDVNGRFEIPPRRHWLTAWVEETRYWHFRASLLDAVSRVIPSTDVLI